ncbi:type III pantothenate kinase [Thermopolyspora flexuosa]|jgi:type III pantothenate kinase|uniref:Type III pantothenate kinase n=1 Tax=Thermopolyspora flexuosa TaxID=103836 RepID=A0A543J3V7_9ACTN|nr:type III pantothenate kinase [Thermopolyspora flexuosa]TQM77500.1 pantothenate kinase [Thermopolyspora flexuosa]GGM72923.1 type III pantothenate kinase [Thermopolyspora flexuosa]
MLLAVDVSNTHTVLGLFEGEEVIEHWRIATDPRRTADEIAVVLQGLLAQSPLLKNADISGIAICSTVPSVLNEMREMSRRYYGDVPTVVVEPGVRTGVPVRMDNPKEVGADRVVNALAAYTLYRGPCVVVDFGTATSFDAVSAKGEYVGAVTAPGIEISVDALASAGAQLHKVELVRPRSVIAKNAVEALQSGIVYGFAGLVDGIVERMAAELSPNPEEVTVVATGSLAPLVVGEAGSIDIHEPWLTLIGLRLIYQKNVSQ